MIKPILKINWSKFDDAVPAFIALVLIPFTYSITQGIIWGFLSWTSIKILTGKWDEVNLKLIGIDIFAILALFIE
jgi:AGZA family xanthine/uracil permease-like MFS transporter